MINAIEKMYDDAKAQYTRRDIDMCDKICLRAARLLGVAWSIQRPPISWADKCPLSLRLFHLLAKNGWAFVESKLWEKRRGFRIHHTTSAVLQINISKVAEALLLLSDQGLSVAEFASSIGLVVDAHMLADLNMYKAACEWILGHSEIAVEYRAKAIEIAHLSLRRDVLQAWITQSTDIWDTALRWRYLQETLQIQ